MIKTPTLFILGAGSSMPYGFPSGLDLIDRILDIETSDLYPEDSNEYVIHDDHVEEFNASLRTSGVYSIDSFIHKNRVQESLAKLMIAKVITDCENPEYLARAQAEPSDNWYRYFWHNLHDGMPDWKDLYQNAPISIITFNYDTSLENYIYRAFLGLYKSFFQYSIEAENEARRFVSSLNLIHVFGTTAGFKQPNASNDNPLCREYGNELKPTSHGFNQRVANGIQTIHEVKQLKDEIGKQIDEAFARAQRIISLGFSYNFENLKLIGLPENFGEEGKKQIIFSAYKIHLPMLRKIENELTRKVRYFQNWPSSPWLRESVYDYKSLEFLERSGALID